MSLSEGPAVEPRGGWTVLPRDLEGAVREHYDRLGLAHHYRVLHFVDEPCGRQALLVVVALAMVGGRARVDTLHFLPDGQATGAAGELFEQAFRLEGDFREFVDELEEDEG